MTSDRNDSVKILNHWDSFLPDISDSILKSNYAKLLARSIVEDSDSAKNKITTEASHWNGPVMI